MLLMPLVSKLSRLVALREEEVQALIRLPTIKCNVRRNRDAIVKGETPSYLYVVLSGWAARYSLRPDGSRRITGFLLQGDFCGIHAVCHARMDHSILALTDCTLAKIQIDDLNKLASSYPSISRALWHAKLSDEAVLRAWLLNSNDASRTIAHLLCELEARLNPPDSVNNRTIELPLTQEQIGDALGITPVHTNRTLRRLRERGLASLHRGTLHIPDLAGLRKEASFDPSYLHFAA